MRKYVMIVISLIVLFSVVACSNGSNSASDNALAGGVGTPDEAQTGGENTAKTNPESTPMPPLDPNKKSTVVFAMYDNDPYFQDAKRAYEEKHPNITIDVKYVVNKGNEDVSGTLLESFQATTLTDFLRGKGSDMIVTGKLPVNKYIGNHLFANLSLMMDNDSTFKKERYFQNILDGVREGDGGIYAMPLSFSMSGLVGDEEVLNNTGVEFDDKTWSWAQFMETGKALTALGDNKSALSSEAPEYLLNWWVDGNYTQLVDSVNRKAYFDSDLFIQMLEQIKTREAEGVLSFNYAKSPDHKKGEIKESYFEQWGFEYPYQYIFFMNELKKKGFKKPKVFALPIADGQSPGGHFTPQMNIAINANSSVQPEAWDFLKFLMSGEAKASTTWGPNDLSYAGQGYNGLLPISRAVYEEKAAQLLQVGQVESVIPEDGMIQVTKEDLQQLEALILNANKLSSERVDIGISLYNEVKAFYSGQKSAEAVAKIIQNKVTTYLNE